MAKKVLTKQTQTLDAHSSLSDRPNINEGFTPTEVKTRFDRDVNRNKDYLNDTLTEELADETLGSSGSNAIGHNSTSITADNVGDALEENRQAIDSLETADGQNVKLTGNQIIAGTKTLSSNLNVPLTPTLSTHATSKEYVDNQAPLNIPNDSITNLKMATDVKIGSLATLLTTVKNSITNAINEVFGYSITPKQNGGDLIINGNFDINQEGFGPFTGAVFTSDQWEKSTQGQVDVVTDVPDVGSKYSLKYSLSGASQSVNLLTKIENQNNVLYNKQCTLSFFVKSSVPKTLTALLRNETSATTIDSYSYSTTTSWEKKEITFNASSSWTHDNVIELRLISVNVLDDGDEVFFSKVKLEIGNVSTEFVPKKFADELRDCQRYYYSTLFERASTSSRLALGQCIGTTNARIYLRFPVRMRINPTFTSFGNFAITSSANGTLSVTSFSTNVNNVELSELNAVVASGLVAGDVTQLKHDSDSTADLRFDARL